jgi:hypothetical protein
MGIQGLNITITIKRASTDGRDEVGGATTTISTIATGIKARISSLKPTEELRIQGFETSKHYNMVMQPITQSIREGDYVVPESGTYINQSFRVTGVQVDSLLPSDPRAHLSVRMLHEDIARVLQ